METTMQPLCPKCGEPLEERPSVKGPFWGCPNFWVNGCRGTVPFKLPADRKPTLKEPTSIVLVDTETTGTSLLSEVVEVAVLVLNVGCKPIAPVRSWLVKPVRRIPDEAIEIHGISNQMVASAPLAAQVMRELVEYVRPHAGSDPAWLAHKASFDLGMLDRAFGAGSSMKPGWPFYCSLEIAKECFPKLKHHSLDHLTKRLGLPPAQAHRATGDVQTTAAMMGKAMKVWDEFSWGARRLAGRL